MAAPVRAVTVLKLPIALATCLALLLGVPLLWVSGAAVMAGWDQAAWQTLGAEPQLASALGLTLGTGLGATVLAWLLAAVLLSHSFPGPRWTPLVRCLSPLLAVPHAAMAIGLVFLLSPSGWLLRLLSPWATGLDAPPPWRTTQDPWGLGLVAVLVLKEVPFLLWTAASQLQREDVGQRLARELQLARSLGYQPHTAWWQVVWPQLWPRLWGPTLAVLAYSLTVVDMALVIGPASPPTLAVLAWQWLMDADPAVNATGAAAAWALAGVVGFSAALLAWGRGRIGAIGSWGRAGGWRGRARADGRRVPSWPAVDKLPGLMLLLLAVYGAVMLALAVGSVSGIWPFPDLLPQRWTLQAWGAVLQSAATVLTTLALGLLAAATALLWSVAWLECAPPAWDRVLRQWVYLPLLLPSVLWVLGLHRLSLAWGMDARFSGLWLAHSLAALPYVLIALSPAYQGFDPRYGQLAASLGKSRLAFLGQVKWPMLKAALASALAVGFAVSVAQYLPTLFIGAGRFATVTTEAVTLASGAQRSLAAAYAWLQWLLPVLGFAAAAWAGRPRRFATLQERL